MKSSNDIIQQVKLIDEYKMPNGETSLTFRIVFQALDRTLTNDEVNRVMKRLEQAMIKKGWKVR